MKSIGFFGLACVAALLLSSVAAAATPLGPEDVIGSKDGKSLFVALLDAKLLGSVNNNRVHRIVLVNASQCLLSLCLRERAEQDKRKRNEMQARKSGALAIPPRPGPY